MRCRSSTFARRALLAVPAALLTWAIDAPQIRFEKGVVIIRGWHEAATTRPEHWKENFSVFVDPRTANTPPMLGSFRLAGGDLIFQPRFPLQEGVRYRAILKTNPPVESVFEAPRSHRGTAARIERVFPSASRLPENQLKFYVHFSAPMSRGEAYRHISLLDGAGSAVELPFLELEQELWDPAGVRLTLLFDPGRIKRGLLPHEEVGGALEAGGKYVLVIGKGWLDAAGLPLAEEYRKEFTAIAADRIPPDPSNWRISTPPPGTLSPVEVRFPDPMDHALLGRMLAVNDSAGGSLRGQSVIGQEETLWQFIPAAHWKRGVYTLTFDMALEDLAGNRIGRPFDVDLLEPASRQKPGRQRSLSFEVR